MAAKSVTKWSNVRVAVQSALGADAEIASITQDNPGVVTLAAAAPIVNGDYVVMHVEGMHEVDGRVFRAANAAGSSFELEGEDTTNYEAFTEGIANEVTYGVNMTTATGLTAAGGDFDYLDITTIHDTIRKQVPGLPAAATYTFENLWNPSDAALIELKKASDNQEERAVRFTFANQQKVLFNGYVGATLLPIGNAQDVVKTTVAMTMFGRPTIYVV